MTAQEPDSGREVTTKDLETIDKAIASHEGLGLFLYTTRRILSEIGKLEQTYQNTKSGIEHLQAQQADVARQWEHAKAELATVQQQEVEKAERRRCARSRNRTKTANAQPLLADHRPHHRGRGMIDKQSVDRLIADLQQLSADYAEHEAFAAKHAKVKAEHETVARELAQFRRELSDLQLQYQDKRQQLGQLMADIVRRGTELQRIDSEIQQAKQRAFGG